MPDPRVSSGSILRVADGASAHADDILAVEEPLEIRVAARAEEEMRERPLSVTMRTPGDDEELTAGFLLTEGVVPIATDIASIRHWGSANVVRAELAEGVRVDWRRLQRHFYTSSSCGVCGKTSVEAVRTASRPFASSGCRAAVVPSLPALLRESQQAFASTGGLHAAAVVSADGEILTIREDVGRHNAVDKVIGAHAVARRDIPEGAILFLSGRAGFELVQKAAVAGISTVAAVGAPSSLAVDLAKELGMTLIGFVRENRFNVYCGSVR